MMIGVQGLSFTVRFEIRWTVRMSAVESACRYDGRSFLSRACHDRASYHHFQETCDDGCRPRPADAIIEYDGRTTDREPEGGSLWQGRRNHP